MSLMIPQFHWVLDFKFLYINMKKFHIIIIIIIIEREVSYWSGVYIPWKEILGRGRECIMYLYIC